MFNPATLLWIRRNPPAIMFATLCVAWITYVIVLVVRNAQGKDK